MPKRTDNEIKNYWNTHLKKRLVKMGIDPVTHKPKNATPLSSLGGISKNAATLSHMAQWESARLEAEARLARESKILHYQTKPSSHHHGFTHKTLLTTWTSKTNQGKLNTLTFFNGPEVSQAERPIRNRPINIDTYLKTCLILYLL